MVINFIYSKNVDEECVIYTKSDNKEFMTYNNASNIVHEIFNRLTSRHLENLEKRMDGSDFFLI